MQFYDLHPVLTWTAITYGTVSGLITLPTVRPPFINWYRSQSWFIWGKGPVDILFKQVGYRLGFEFFVFLLSVVFGSLGGWLYIVIRASKEVSKEKVPEQIAPL